jgi:hypothetical protein
VNPHTIESLSGRPDTHSVVFVIALAAFTLIVTRRVLAAWSAFAVNLIHLLFDGAGGSEHILYPFSNVDGVPWLAFPLGALGLLTASSVLADVLMRPPSRRRHDVLPAG